MPNYKKFKAPIVGDTMNIEDGQLIGKNTQIINEEIKAINSLKKLMEHDVENMISYHRVIQSDIKRID